MWSSHAAGRAVDHVDAALELAQLPADRLAAVDGQDAAPRALP
jgi:hypothetical protein